jgi:hypothetical protein
MYLRHEDEFSQSKEQEQDDGKSGRSQQKVVFVPVTSFSSVRFRHQDREMHAKYRTSIEFRANTAKVCESGIVLSARDGEL